MNDMSDERRYDEQESAHILERASADAEPESGPAGAPGESIMRPPRGLTLQQLQDIGAEAGISRDAVARAATAVGRGDLVPTERRTYVGLPVGVARTIEIPRRVTDEEWDRIVVALRETFNARGRVDRMGTLREWRNGNLLALLEPTARGHRLRLSTTKGDARLQLGFGAGALLAGVATGLPLWLVSAAASADALWSPVLMATMGIGAMARAAWMLPRWARTRASQMESLAERVSRIVEEGEAEQAQGSARTIPASTGDRTAP
jgi:hypothetical protein